MSDLPGPSVPAELLRWAQLEGPALVLAAARQRLERGQSGSGPLAVDLTGRHREQAGQLFGLDWQGSGKRPTLRMLRDCLARYDLTVETMLGAAGGPIVDRRAARAGQRAERDADAVAARDLLAVNVPDQLLEEVVRECLPAKRQTERAEQLTRVAAKLPAQHYLPVLAAECFGDAHALDRTRSLGQAAARMAAIVGGRSAPGGAMPAEEWRLAWASVGVLCDRVSSLVLVLNLPLTGAPALTACSGVRGEPVWLTVRMLDSAQPPSPAPAEVFVCENPSILESAADRLGSGCAPLICTFGKPSQAALMLVRLLSDAGVQLHVRADNDPAGRQIVRAVQAVAPGSLSWRFTPNTPVYEEEIVGRLLADLGRVRNPAEPHNPAGHERPMWH